MPLARVVISILLGLIILGSDAAAQKNERVTELADKALSIIRSSDEAWSRARLLSKVALLLASNEEIDASAKIFDEAIERISSEELCSQLLEVAEQLADAEFFDRALSLVREAPKHEDCIGSQVDRSRAEIARSMARNDCWELAKSTCDEIKDHGIKSQTLANLAVIAQRQGKRNSAEVLLDDAVAVANSISNSASKFSARAFIVETFIDSRFHDVALELTAMSAAEANDAYGWLGVLGMEADCGNVDDVRTAHEKYKAFSKSPDDEYLLHYLAVAHANNGQMDDAVKALNELSKLEGNQYRYGVTTFVGVLIRTDHLDEATKWAEKLPMDEDGRRDHRPFLDIAMARFRFGDLSAATDLLQDTCERVRSQKPSFYGLEFFDVGHASGIIGLDDEFERWVENLDSSNAKSLALIGLGTGILYRANASK